MNNDDESEFSRLIPPVKRLHSDRVNTYSRHGSRQPSPPAKNRQVDPPIAFPDESTAAHDSRFNPGLQKKLQRKIKQGVIRPESSIDLHGYRQTEALEALETFIADALQRRLRMVLVIHGQGYRSQNDAVLKPLIQRWLANQSQVLAWCPAQAHDGAGGASYIYLHTS